MIVRWGPAGPQAIPQSRAGAQCPTGRGPQASPRAQLAVSPEEPLCSVCSVGVMGLQSSVGDIARRDDWLWRTGLSRPAAQRGHHWRESDTLPAGMPPRARHHFRINGVALPIVHRRAKQRSAQRHPWSDRSRRGVASRPDPIERDVLARIRGPLKLVAERIDGTDRRLAPCYELTWPGLRAGWVHELWILAGDAGRPG